MKKLSLAVITLPLLATASSALAFEKGDILVQGGFATVAPDESWSNIVVGEDLGFGLTIDTWISRHLI
jgi:outer membrane protein